MGTNAVQKQASSPTLSRDLADFVMELAVALHKMVMYPDGHLSLKNAEERVMERLESLLRERQSLALGVAREQLVVEGVATDPKNPLVRGLARHLHRHSLGAVKFLAGIRREEIAEALRAIASDPERGGVALGGRDAPVWEHVRLFTAAYDGLRLLDEEEKQSANSAADALASHLWLELAQAAMQSDRADEPETDPKAIARAISAHEREPAYDQVVVGYMLKIANELNATGRTAPTALQQRISQLVNAMERDQLRELLQMGGDIEQRKKFVVDAAQSMALDAVMILVQTAAEASQQVISTPLMRLFSKLAEHADGGAIGSRREADAALREQVQELVTGWTLRDPNPSDYSATLERMVKRSGAHLGTDETHMCEPERIVQMTLETGTVGPESLAAVDALIEQEQLGLVVSLLERAPAGSDAVATLWLHVATVDRLVMILKADSAYVEYLDPFIRILGMQAAVPLLDSLNTSASRSVRSKVMSLLEALGPGVAHLAAARLPRSPWYVQRNLLIVLERLCAWPPGFSPLPYVAHSDPRVRRQAIRLLLKFPDGYDRAVCSGLRDPDGQIVRTAFTAALEKCPASAVPIILERLSTRQFGSELELASIRVLGKSGSSEALAFLVQRALSGRKWLLWRCLGAKSHQLLAILATLAAHWPTDLVAARVLDEARNHRDPEIRAAVVSRSGIQESS
jgi:hypothetical protein